MKTNEDFANFVNWVKDMSTRAKFTVPQDQMIQMIVNNIHGTLKSFLLMNEYTSFEQHYARATVLQRNLKDPSVSGFFEAKPRTVRKAPTPAPAPAPTTEGVTTSEQVNLVFQNTPQQPVQKFVPQF